MRLFLAMLIITTIEVILIAKVGAAIGFFNTFMIIIATALLGSWQLRKQWHFVMSKLHNMTNEPSQALIEALVLLICGVLLITPGFLTDIIGFLGLVPAVREQFAQLMRKNAASMMQGTTTRRFTMHSQTRYHRQEQHSPYDTSDNVIEGEFERKDDH